jgi:hypothetical protein
MSQDLARQTPDPPQLAVSPATTALDRCMAAYNMACRAAGTVGANLEQREIAACRAYRMALPQMETLADIKAFINCITHGLAIGAFEGQESTQLLYAAQVALSAIGRKAGKE